MLRSLRGPGLGSCPQQRLLREEGEQRERGSVSRALVQAELQTPAAASCLFIPPAPASHPRFFQGGDSPHLKLGGKHRRAPQEPSNGGKAVPGSLPPADLRLFPAGLSNFFTSPSPRLAFYFCLSLPKLCNDQDSASPRPWGMASQGFWQRREGSPEEQGRVSAAESSRKKKKKAGRKSLL